MTAKPHPPEQPESQSLEQTRGKGVAVFHPTPDLQEPNMNKIQAKPRVLDDIAVVRS
ncbi:hypothetical protein [Pseudomonas sp. DNDY-54]|uniref:hypothetical protein n=1 Tax=Pseudomonas sp. DNDY-54 TaxID=2870860 RepID=UPI001CA43B54|nr:hypothetical protein [Pseudomonas sp. DNDY-54]